MEILNELTTYALIDLDAVAANVRAIRAHIGEKCELIAVVKANAYGHGAIPVARSALEAGASRLAVARVEEGIALRRAGISAPVLVMGYSVPGEATRGIEYNLTLTVNSVEVAQAISVRASADGHRVPIHIKIDTGMGRFGLLPDEALPFVEQISTLPGLALEGIFTHFATADEADKGFTRQQHAVFIGVLNTLAEAGYRFKIRHAANSAATLDLVESHLDAVRCGIMLYGLKPSNEVLNLIPLQPVMSIKSHVGRVRTLPAGSSVGYGRSYVCERPTQVALIPVGYGDLYHRVLSNKGMVLVGGRSAPVIGRISMDQTMVDVSAVPGVQEGDEAVLIGGQGDETITADDLAAIAETINYEVTTSVLPRVPRVFVRGGAVVEVLR